MRVAMGVLAAMVLLVIALAMFDWNQAKPWLNARISEATQRPFAINGNLSLEWQRPDASENGGHGWIPWPHLRAQDIHMGNPEGIDAKAPFAQVAQLRFSLNPFPLLTRDIVIPAIYLDQAQFHLLRNKQEQTNWTFASGGEKSPWQVAIGEVQFRNGSIHLVDAVQQIDATVKIDTLPASGESGFRTRWTVAGSLQEQKLAGEGRAGALLALRKQHEPFPLQAFLRAGDTALVVEGTVTGIPAFEAADLRLDLAGDSMAHLYPIIGVLLPHTPQYATKGRLLKRGSTWHYQDFSGTVGQSDLAGDLTLDLEGARPRLEGQLISRQLRLQDLGPLTGGGDKENLAKGDEAEKQPDDKVLPVREFDTEKWQTLDAEVQFRAKRFIRQHEIPLEDMVTRLKLDKGVLSLNPLNFGMAGGKLNTQVRLDGSKKLIKATIDVSARGLKLNQLFPAVEELEASLGEVYADAKLSGQGNSVSEMLAASNGEVKALISEGTISKFLLEAIGLNIGSLIMTRLFGDEQLSLNCMAADLKVEDGIVRSRGFVMDTEQAVIRAGGRINLGKEELALSIQAENKRLRLLSLRSPIYVRGSFEDPQIGVDKGAIATQAGGALVLGLAAPVAAALLPLINPGEGEQVDSGCQRVLRQAQAEPKAPAPDSSGQ